MALKVLVAISLLPQDDRLVGWLDRLAAQLREPPELTLMHVVATTAEPYGAGLAQEHEEATAALTRLNRGQVRVEVGTPGRLLVEASRDFDLLVVGGGGRTQLGEALLGSISQHVIHHAHCPVLVVRPA